MDTKKFYYVGNAHLDPVWQWRWQEGSTEAKATIRSALDRMKEFPNFKFVCAGSSVFKWIETFDPDMFCEIQDRVKEKRFIIVGGMFVQPDCNLPSGEGFVRQTLYAQRYFYNKFGVTAKTGYNVDSFGHNAMMPQILKKSGMDYYIAMRPGKHEKELPSHVMRWRSPDRSEVLFSRLVTPYTTGFMALENPEHLDKVMEEACREAGEDNDKLLLFYGVGNHGGGPTIQNIKAIEQHAEQHPDVAHIFSDTHDFFEEVEQHRESLALLEDDLQHHASGCYSAVSAVKTQVRRAEWDLYSAENYAMLAQQLTGRCFAQPKDFENAWENVLFAHFHDVMGGCCVPEAYEDTDIFLKASRATAQKIENDALQTISWNIDTSNAEKGIPIIVFNPHGFPVYAPVTVRRRIVTQITDDQGNPVPTQLVRSADSRCRNLNGNTLFMAQLPAFGYRTYYFKTNLADSGFTAYSKLYPEEPVQQAISSPVNVNNLTLENEYLRVTLDKDGCLSSVYHKASARELLQGKGAVPVVLDESDYDTWAHDKFRWENVVGTFGNAKTEILENGPVRATIKVVSHWGQSTLTQYFSLCQGCDQLDVRARIDWHETRKMLKLRFDTAFTRQPQAWYEIPYGVFPRPADGEEEPGQSFAAILSEGQGIALLNDNKYSYSIFENQLNLTVVRSPYYNDHAIGDQDDPESQITDQGEHEFRYSLLPADLNWDKTIRRAKLLNKAPTAIMENNHEGKLPDHFGGLHCGKENVVISAWKQAENGNGIILRAYETNGMETEATISGTVLPVPLNAKFTPFSVQTYYLEKGNNQWTEVLLTEFSNC